MKHETKTRTSHILMDLPMPIYTPRLIIRPVMPGDGAAIHAAKIETWDEIRPWMPWAKILETVEETKTMVREHHAKFLMREDFMMIACERDTDRPVIFTGIHRPDWEVRRLEVGFWCRKSAMGIGLVTESTNAIVRYAFNVMAARTVSICHAHDNDKSRRVIERLNFHYEGRLRNATITPDGKIHDHMWYSHTNVNDLPPLDITWGGP